MSSRLSHYPKPAYCVNGRLLRHDPQDDDPELLTDIGECLDCSGDACSDDPLSMFANTPIMVNKS